MYMHLLAEVRNACRATLHVRQHPTRFPCTNPNVRRCPSAAGAACDAILDPASPGAGGRGLAESTIDSAVYRQHDVDQESSDPAQKKFQHQLGDARWRDLRKLSGAIVHIVANSKMEGARNEK